MKLFSLPLHIKNPRERERERERERKSSKEREGDSWDFMFKRKVTPKSSTSFF